VNPVPFSQVVTPLVTVVLTSVSVGQTAFHFICKSFRAALTTMTTANQFTSEEAAIPLV